MMRKIILKRASNFRSFLLKLCLYLSGFRVVSGHWIFGKSILKNSIVLDLGANIGSFSKSMVKRYSCNCFAVEPNSALLGNLDEKKVIKIPFAVTSRDQLIDFYINSNHEASSVNENFQTIWGKTKKVQVRSITLFTLLKEFDLENKKIEIVKLDIEGSEIEVIKTINKEISKYLNQITVEFHFHLNSSLLPSTKEAISQLNELGYHIISHRISPTEIVFIKPEILRLNFVQNFFFYQCFNRFKFKPFEVY